MVVGKIGSRLDDSIRAADGERLKAVRFRYLGTDGFALVSRRPNEVRVRPNVNVCVRECVRVCV